MLSAAAPALAARSYRRRRPELGVLHATVHRELETFLASRRSPDTDGVPRFIEKALRSTSPALIVLTSW